MSVKGGFLSIKRRLAWVLLLALLAMLLPSAPTASAVPPPGHSDRILRIKLVDGTTADLQTLLPAELAALVQKVDPLFTLPKSKLKELKDKGDEKLKKEKGDGAPLLPDLRLWYEVKLRADADPDAALELFQAQPFVEIANPAPLPLEPPDIPSTPTPNFTGGQGYLGAAPGGVDAEYAWTLLCGRGAGITIYDIEYGWWQNHEDLSQAHGLSLLLNAGDAPLTAYQGHGTAVLGEMIGDHDSKGVTGIAWGAQVGLAPANTANLGYNPANAILLAAAAATPGDVILIEQQTSVCGLASYGPSEWESAVFQAIQTATANGLVVVEAAGNGAVNLDQSACGTAFNRSSRDSGAIIVGAGRPPASGYDRQRESFSSYGSRVDLQGWGSGVMTAGGDGGFYGFNEWYDEEYFYTDAFNGTSSASPIVAAAAAVIQGVALATNGTPLSPGQVRNLLVQTGSPQQGNTGEPIGPRPNLRAAIAQLPQTGPTLIVNSTASTNDGVCGVGHCTLREALGRAGADGVATSLELAAAATYTLDAVDNTDATYGANGLPVIASPVTINAQGAVIERSSAAGTPDFRLFQVATGGMLTVNQATLRNGKASGGSGGAVLNLGTTTISRSTLSGGSAAQGGALANQNTLSMDGSTVANNSATTSGGAIQDSGALTILGSTLAGNSAPTGANLATSGSPILKNTLLVKGASGANCAGTLASNSLANLADDSSCGASATVAAAAAIALGALGNNGGATQTMALGSASSAIDKGNATACQGSPVNGRDQRLYNRFVDGPDVDTVAQCDIGAHEYGSSPLPPTTPLPDSDPPQVRIILAPGSPDGANGWYRSAVTVAPQARDASAVIEVRCALDPAATPAAYGDLPEALCPFLGGAEVPADGVHTLYAAAMDIRGNRSDVVSTGFQIDATPPTLTCPAAGPFLLHSGEQAAGPAGVDASVSGLDEAASTLSGMVPTDSTGPKTLTFSATDLAGNQATQECSYHVIFDFGGYYPPVEPAPALNPAQAGRAVPLKFSLAGDQGLNVIELGSPASQPLDCTSFDPNGELEPAQAAGGSGLSYDAASDQYTYVWKTEKAWAGTCRALTIRLVDGTEHHAYFKFD